MKHITSHLLAVFFVSIIITLNVHAQDITTKTFSGLKFRNIGPALTTGRISDIAIDPVNENIWYVGVASGGVWKTTNAGTTWQPVFDGQKTFSIGCISIDPNNRHTIWVGTGENVGGRHVGIGDGVYVSYNDGKSWQNKGLSKSEHIAKIIVHPENSNTIWVASQGPLWSKGGERGIFKSIDGGKTWKNTLHINDWTGATDLLIDPKNPDVLYAATWQRHRTVANYLGGGPGSGIYKSTDGGEHWQKLSQGLPKSNLGKIGLAMSPFDNETIYAAVETDRITGGFYLSRNGGQTWHKQSDIIAGGTGPHYYQEIYASPHHKGRIYFTSNYSMVSDDEGKTWHRLNEKNKHVDTHAIAFKKSDPNYVIFGTDGGLYETFDDSKSWHYFDNLPITQFYKIAVDDAKPFYHIYGGTQDNGTQKGPSQTTSAKGISNCDWDVILGADGYSTAVEPHNPNIAYGEFQEGMLWRVDQITGDAVAIQPQPKQDEPMERYNWDAPILVSPHNPKRIYIGSQRLWQSDDRGDTWHPISKDLTRNQERFALPVMGKQQSWDNAWDVIAMSNYNTISVIDESPVKEGLIYVGTDDGFIQITENGGKTWRKIDVKDIKGIPGKAFVNDIKADRFDTNVVYAALDRHKMGDYKPYIIKSNDRGHTWHLISGNLPDKHFVWRLVQDYKDKNLLFAGTEYGLYFTLNAGKKWLQLKGGLPTIAFRDLKIQQKDDDLVCGTFGRGIFILDDLSPIRKMNKNILNKEAYLFDIKPALWYKKRPATYAQGDNKYYGKNPPFGAVFTYYLKDKYKSLKEKRREKEKKLTKNNAGIPFPGWKNLDKEKNEISPQVILTIRDGNNKVIKTIKGSNKKGLNRINWPLTYDLKNPELLNRNHKKHFGMLPLSNGLLVPPGTYTVSISKFVDGNLTELVPPKSFEVVPLYQKQALKPVDNAITQSFRNKYQKFIQKIKAVQLQLDKNLNTVNAMLRAYNKADVQNPKLLKNIYNLRNELLKIKQSVYGYSSQNEVEDHQVPSPAMAMRFGWLGLNSMYGPTGQHRKVLEESAIRLEELKQKIQIYTKEKIPALQKALRKAGAPWIEGEEIPE